MSGSWSRFVGLLLDRPARRTCLTATALLLAFALPGRAQPTTPDPARAVTQPAPQSPGQPSPGPGQPARDTARAADEASQPGTIRGRITALDTGRPLRRVQVRLNGEKMRRAPGTVTDAEGRYELRNLAPGRYTIWVQKGGYVPLSYGQRGPRDPGRPVEVASGQTLDRIDMRLPRGSVITGRVVDEFGEPMSSTVITVLQYQRMGGRRQLVQTGGGNTTNDIGQYRVFGLPPGSYYVTASSHGMGFDDTDLGADASDYEPTFYPGTPDPAAAQPVNVTIGEEAVADIQLTPTRVHSVSGVAVDSTGKPITSGWVSIVRKGAMLRGDMRGGTQLDAEGNFTVHGLSAGTYVLLANEMGRMRGPRMADEDNEIARAVVTIAGEDVTGLRLAGVKGGVLRGRVLFEGGPAPTDRLRGSVSCLPVDEDMGMGGGMRTAQASLSETTKGDSTFELKGIFGPCIIYAYLESWRLKAVRVGGAEVLEQPIEVPSQKPITDVELVFTNQLTTVLGSVTGADGGAVKDYAVMVFPEDAAKWEQARWMNARVRVVRSDQAGLFKIRSLPPGEYLVVAMENIDPSEDQDPEVLDRLRPLATPARLTEGGTATLTMKLSTRPPP